MGNEKRSKNSNSLNNVEYDTSSRRKKERKNESTSGEDEDLRGGLSKSCGSLERLGKSETGSKNKKKTR